MPRVLTGPRPARSAHHSGWLFAPAKLNLTLRVTGRRPDGYHLLDSTVVPLALGDRLRCTLWPHGLDGASQVELRCVGQPALDGAANLAARVAAAFFDEIGACGFLELQLFKDTPTQAGLGGGSSDAAAVLAWLLAVFGPQGWPAERLHAWAAGFGADLPLFMHGGAVRMRGIGEQVTPLAGQRRQWVVLARPPADYTTAAVYQAYDQLDSAAPALAHNDLLAPALALCPAIGQALDDLAAAGAPDPRLTGSGACCYALCDTRAEAAALLARLPPRVGWWYHLSATLPDWRPAGPQGALVALRRNT